MIYLLLENECPGLYPSLDLLSLYKLICKSYKLICKSCKTFGKGRSFILLLTLLPLVRSSINKI